jgi:hypothetical protein
MRLITGTTLVVALAAGALIGLAPPATAAGSGTITVQLATPDGTAIRPQSLCRPALRAAR